jgi:hypothetical protein
VSSQVEIQLDALIVMMKQGGIFFVDRVPTALMGSNTNLTPKMRMYSMMYPMVPKAFDLH